MLRYRQRPGLITRTANVDRQFSPSMIAGLSLWLDANDAGTITASSGAVSKWDDKSGNLRHASQTVAAQKPTTGSATINSKNAISFDGNDALTLASSIPAGNLTVFIVSNITSAAAIRTFVAGSAGSTLIRLNTTTGGIFQIVRQDQAVILSGTTNPSYGTAQLYAFKTTSSLNQIWQNETSDGSNTTNPAYTAALTTIGAKLSTGTEGMLGSIGEILIYNTDVSTADMNSIGDYLAIKWLSGFSSGFSTGYV